MAMAAAFEARPETRPPRVALVFNSVAPADLLGADPVNPFARSFIRGLRERGYVEGQGLVLERHSADGRPERLPAIMDRLIGLPVDIIVTAGNGALAAARATSSIPIVANIDDPVGLGLTTTLARPSRNITGITDAPDLSIHSKRLQLLKEATPTATRVAVIDFKYVDSEKTRGTHLRRGEIEATARQLRMTPIWVGADSVDELKQAFAVVASQRAEALLEMGNPVTLAGRRAIVEFAARERLPAIYASREFVDSGGLLAYGPDIPSLFGRMAEFVDKLLKGAKIADLPFEHPTKFDLIVNMKAARALGLEVPRSVLLSASEIIQ
jgi:putative ABC transport system substrate-binding protein